MKLFGFEITRKQDKAQQSLVSVVPPNNNDGATVISDSPLGNYYSAVMDIEGTIKSDNDLIRRYRDAAMFPECDSAIDEIVNEAIVSDGNKQIVTLDLDAISGVPDSIKKKIIDEFSNVLDLLDFQRSGTDIFRMWYIDGRLFYHMMFIPGKEKDGIQELRYIDPRKIKKIKTVTKDKVNGVDVIKEVKEYYLYNDGGMSTSASQGVPLSLDSVAYASSGLVDPTGNYAISYLHKSVKSVNMLKMMEDALVIYRVTRAPERRIFYVDVGNLPKQKAEQYVNDIMNRYKNKISYDANTGEVREDRRFLSMLEDFWMPRREGGRGTEITTLPGGQTLGQIDDVQFFQTKLYQSLNVPVSRLQAQQGFSLGRSTEITRDEIKFNKFITKLRSKFNVLFTELLKVQLVSKGILRIEDWEKIVPRIKFEYNMDNHFAEIKNNELLNMRINTISLMDPFIGRYYSKKWVQKNVLSMTDEEIEDMQEEMDEETALEAKMQAQMQQQNPQDVNPEQEEQ